jgi:hypothetical protein
MSVLISALDRGLAVAGEDVILHRTVGEDTNVVIVDVTCRARVDAVDNKAGSAGLQVSEYNLIMSPTQIINAQWPGGGFPQVPPFNVDQGIPRANSTDQVLLRGEQPRIITMVDAKIIGGELVRVNLRVSG